MFRRWWQAFSASSLLVLVVVVWVIFAPLQLGGQTSLIIVNGESMEPGFHLGDLVVVRQADDYRVGDVVAYRSDNAGVFVFHRIIARDLDRYVLKGDNNSWIDTYQPEKQDVVGRLWVHLPGFGKAVQKVRSPWFMAVVVGLTGVILMALPVNGKSRNKKKKERESSGEWPGRIKKWFYDLFVTLPGQSSLAKAIRAKRSKAIVVRDASSGALPAHPPKGKGWGEAIEIAFFVFGFIALASLALGIFAFTRPLLQNVSEGIQYEHRGAFAYSARAPAGIYDSEVVSSGQPVFPKLTCVVNLRFSYALAGEDLQGVTGTHQITAVILENRSKWTRSISLTPERTFSGNAFTAFATLDLCEVEELVQAMEQATDLKPVLYSLIITPRVEVTGILDGEPLQDTFEPSLVLQFDKVHAYLYTDDPASDPLNPVQAGLVDSTRTQANTLPLFGLRPEVARMRTLALAGFGLSTIGLLVIGLFVLNTEKRDRQSYMQMKYGPMLIDVQNQALDATLPLVDVVTMDDLAKLAERRNSLILHETSGLLHSYFVQDDRIVYRYTIDESDGEILVGVPRQENTLLEGIERGEFRVYYQPIFSLGDGRVSAVEALLRWQHPQRGLVSAAEFIRLAEKTGLIDTLGEWMLQVACAQFKEWQATGLDIKLAVNLSERQLERDPARFVSRALRMTGVAPASLQVEISESSLMANMPEVLSNLLKLKALGVQISVDDFAGLSSLASLQQYPVNSIKIDRLYLEKVVNPDSAADVSSMIAAARSQGLDVFAKGVETEVQLGFLRQQPCTLAQGYLLGRPLPADEVTDLLRGEAGPESGTSGPSPAAGEEENP